MASSTYEAALARLLAHEGGYTNHPDDPGGPTNFGITIADYRRYAKADATAADVRAMPVDAAKAIYRRRYWDAQRCDELPAGVDYAVFDYGVNSGIGRSGKVLRRVLRLADDSARVTDDVIAAARAADPGEIVVAICDERLRFLKSLRTWDVFGKGWARRVAEVKAAALAMAQPRAAPAPPSAPAKAGGAVVAAGGAAAAAHQAGLPLPLVIGIAAAAALAAVIIVHPLKARKG
jgi:lysozyme family protein